MGYSGYNTYMDNPFIEEARLDLRNAEESRDLEVADQLIARAQAYALLAIAEEMNRKNNPFSN
jgi:exosome complex RNA-binding protein Rrp42 (RNase PH superfamily)